MMVILPFRLHVSREWSMISSAPVVVRAAGRSPWSLWEECMFINWDVTARFDPNSLVPSTHGIPIPSYGNYGGPNYTAGVENGTTPEPGSPDYLAHPPKDPLDSLFYDHDLVYQQVKDGLVQDPNAIAKADVTLVEKMFALTQTHLEPETLLYDAVATLSVGGKILTTPSELTYLGGHPGDAIAVLTAVQAAIPNFETGLAETPGNEARSLHGAFQVFEAHFAQQLTQVMASFGAPSTPESSNISPQVSETSQQPLLTTPHHG